MKPARPPTLPTVEACGGGGGVVEVTAAPADPLTELGTLPGPPPHPDRYVVLDVVPCADGYDLRLLPDPAPGGGATEAKAEAEPPPPPAPPLYLRVRGPWADTAPAPGDVVAVADPIPDAPGPAGEPGARVDGAGAPAAAATAALPALLLAPDRLLSGTRVAGGLTCPRAAVLEERFGGEPGAAATAGTLAHEVLGAALADPASAAAAADAAVARSAARLVEVGLTEAAARAAVAAAAAPIAAFAAAYTSAAAPTAPLDAPPGDAAAAGTACLAAVIDIEETVWAPRAGIKGVLDATVAARFGGGAPDPTSDAASLPPAHLVPLELKTGRRHDSHRAQVSLYAALLAARYGRAPPAGLLLYTDGRPPAPVPARAGELASLLARRNALAAALAPGAPLPPLLDPGARRPCGSCFQRVACGVAAAVAAGGGPASRLGPPWDDTIVPLSPAAAAWVGGWLALLDAEDAAATARRAEVWTLSGAEREARGRAVAGLTLLGVTEDADGGWSARFGRGGDRSSQAPPPTPLDAAGFAPGDIVIVGVDGAHPCVARACVAAASADELALALDRGLRTDLAPPSAAWRVDRDEPSAGIVRQRRWLARLFEAAPVGAAAAAPAAEAAARTRRLVVDLAPPAPPSPSARAAALAAGAGRHLTSLNAEQAAFVHRLLGEPDYALCLGLPGTGKTAALAAAARAAVAAGRRVLVTAYTNAAVDNVLLRLDEDAGGGLAMLRVGRAGGVHPRVARFLPSATATAADLAALVDAAPIVGATVLSADAALLRRARPFDVALVDEAGQIAAPAALGALFRAKTWALVGDHYQLPPLVGGGGDDGGDPPESLFQRLATAHPQSVTRLRRQYRMAAPIQALANRLVYGGGLVAGADAVAARRLALPHPLPPPSTPLPAWLAAALDPARALVFVDTAGAGCPDARAGDGCANAGEAALVGAVARGLLAAGLPAAAALAVSPYRAQVAALAAAAETGGWGGIECLTVDKCQGRDRDAVLLSLCRSNPAGDAGRPLADWRRVNVAVTRAKAKLVVIGDASTVRSVPIMAELVDAAAEGGWRVGVGAGDADRAGAWFVQEGGESA